MDPDWEASGVVHWRSCIPGFHFLNWFFYVAQATLPGGVVV